MILDSPIITGSLIVSGSITTTEGISGSMDSAITASYLNGNVTASGHLVPSDNNTYDLGSPTRTWRDLYLSSASLYIDGTQVISSTADVLTFTTDDGQSIKILEGGSDDITLQTSNGNIELKGTIEVTSGKKIIDSAGTIIQFGDSIGVTGSIETTGTVDGIDLQAFSSSVATGLNNTDPFPYTGSAIVSGSLNVIGDLLQNGAAIETNPFPYTGSAEITGSLNVIGTTTSTTFVESSALRYKEDIKPLNFQLDKVLQLKPVSYTWSSTQDQHIGLVAEDVNELYPEFIGRNEQGEVEGIQYSKMVSILIQSIQEQQQQINELKAQLNQK